MIDPVKAFLEANSIDTPIFPPTSRYHGMGTSKLTLVNGCEVVFLRRRFVPQPDRFAVLQEYAVMEGDRIDNIAAHFLGDPEQYWRLCDANGAIRPAELTETLGRRLLITLPEGVPGLTDA
jgi:hypothetical protein